MSSPEKPWESTVKSNNATAPIKPQETSTASSAAPPALPEGRPSDFYSGSSALTSRYPMNRYYNTGSSYNSPYSSYSNYGYNSPYSYSGNYGVSSYGSPYGYGSGSRYGGYGNYSGMNYMNQQPGAPVIPYQSSFQILDSLVQTLGAMVGMLDSTLGATHSSVMAFMGLIEQYRSLKSFFTGELVGNHPNGQSSLQQQPQQQNSKRSSIKPLLVFLLILFGGPYIIRKLLKFFQSKSLPGTQAQSQTQTTSNEVVMVKALYDFNANTPEEISFKKGEHLAVMPPFQQTEPAVWLKGKTRNGPVGFFPSNYVQLVSKKTTTEKTEGAFSNDFKNFE